MAALAAAGRGLGGLRLPTFVVDAFTSRPFAGNPAAVCLLAPGVSLSDELRQKIAGVWLGCMGGGGGQELC